MRRPPTTGAIDWTFEVVPQTNLQTFQSTLARAASVAANVDDRDDGAGAAERAAHAGQHAGGVRLATRMSRDVRQLRHGGRGRIEADFTGVDCNHTTFTGRVVLTKN